MTKFRFQKGFIDPISLIGIGFLIITLIVGTSVAKDKGFSLNISEYAMRINDGDMSGGGSVIKNVRNQDDEEDEQPACVRNCYYKNCGSDGCGKTCGTCGTDKTCNPNGVCIAKVVTPVKTTTPSTSGYDKETAIFNEANKNEIGYDCRRGGCPLGVEVSGFYKDQFGNFHIIGGTGITKEVVENYDNWEKVVIAQKLEAEKAAVAAGQKIVEETAAEYKRLTEIRLEEERIAEENKQKAIQEEQARIEEEKLRAEEDAKNEIQKQESLESENETAQTTNAAITSTRLTPTENLVQELPTTSDLDTGPSVWEKIYDFTLLGKVVNATENPTQYAGDPKYNIAKTFLDDAFGTYTFGKWDNYTDSFRPDKVKKAWETMNYISLEDCQSDIKNKHGSLQAASCNTYDYTEEQLKSSTDLGVFATQVAAAPIAIAQVGTTAIAKGFWAAGGVAFQQMGLLSLTQQAPTAIVTCEMNGFDNPECQQDVARAVFTAVSMGTGNAVNQSPTFLNRAANTIVSAGNLVVDSGDTVDTCYGANKDPLNCAMSGAMLVADVWGLSADYKAGQLSFDPISLSSLNNTPDFGGFPTNLANQPTHVSLTAAMNSTSTSVDTPAVARPVAAIPAVEPDAPKVIAVPVAAIQDLPATADLPDVPTAPIVPRQTAGEWADSQIQNVVDKFNNSNQPTLSNTEGLPSSTSNSPIKNLFAQYVFDGNQFFPSSPLDTSVSRFPDTSNYPDQSVANVDTQSAADVLERAKLLAANTWENLVANPVQRAFDNFAVNPPVDLMGPNVVNAPNAELSPSQPSVLASVRDNVKVLWTEKVSVPVSNYFNLVPVKFSENKGVDNLIKYLVGPNVKNTGELAQKMRVDQLKIIDEYNLPSLDKRYVDIQATFDDLIEITKNNNIKIEIDPKRTSISYDKGTMYLRDITTPTVDNMRKLIHELTHGLDDIYHPNLKIEELEYRAYITDLGDAVKIEAVFKDKFPDYVFGHVETSIINNYKDNNIKVYPWNIPSQATGGTTLGGNFAEGLQNAVDETFNPLAALTFPAPIRNLGQNIADTWNTRFIDGPIGDILFGNPKIYLDQATQNLATQGLSWENIRKAEIADLNQLEQRIIDDQKRMGINHYVTDTNELPFLAKANFPSPNDITLTPSAIDEIGDEFLIANLLHEEGHIVLKNVENYNGIPLKYNSGNEVAASQYAEMVLEHQYGITRASHPDVYKFLDDKIDQDMKSLLPIMKEDEIIKRFEDIKNNALKIRDNTTPPSQPSVLASVRDQVVTLGSQTWNRVTNSWGDFVAKPVQRTIDNFMANPPVDLMRPRGADAPKVPTNSIVKIKIGDTIIIDGKRITVTEGMAFGTGERGSVPTRVTSEGTELNLKNSPFLYQEVKTTGSPDGKPVFTENILSNNKDDLMIIEPAQTTPSQTSPLLRMRDKIKVLSNEVVKGSFFERTEPLLTSPSKNKYGFDIPASKMYFIDFKLLILGAPIFVDYVDMYLDYNGMVGIDEFFKNLFSQEEETDQSSIAPELPIIPTQTVLPPTVIPPTEIIPTATEVVAQEIKSNDEIKTEKKLLSNNANYTQYINKDKILYHVVYFDLESANMVVNTQSARRTTTSSFLNNNNLDIAINGDGWDRVTDPITGEFLRYEPGFSIGNGTQYKYRDANQIMYIDQNHQMKFASSLKEIPDGIQNAISFDNWLVQDGQLADNSEKVDINPRTALGITKDNQIILLVTDGKEYQSGMKVQDLAQLMKDLGAVNAIMFDGGTNSTMVIKGEGTVEKNCNDGSECLVANHLGFQFINE